MEQARGHMGGIDGLVNSAGVMQRGSMMEIDGATWRRVIEINLTGPYLATRTVLPSLLEAQRAGVVNISPTQALLPNSPNARPIAPPRADF